MRRCLLVLILLIGFGAALLPGADRSAVSGGQHGPATELALFSGDLAERGKTRPTGPGPDTSDPPAQIARLPDPCAGPQAARPVAGPDGLRAARPDKTHPPARAPPGTSRRT